MPTPIMIDYSKADPKPRLTPSDIQTLRDAFPEKDGFTVTYQDKYGLFTVQDKNRKVIAGFTGAAEGKDLVFHNVYSELSRGEFEKALPVSIIEKLKINGTVPYIDGQSAQLEESLKAFTPPSELKLTGSFPDGAEVISQSMAVKARAAQKDGRG